MIDLMNAILLFIAISLSVFLAFVLAIAAYFLYKVLKTITDDLEKKDE